MSTPQLLEIETLDYIVYDYLAEITMSIMARARAADPDKGYATDFVTSVLRANLNTIAEKGVKILSNAGGVNPDACGKAVRNLVQKLGLDLKVAVILGDDLMPNIDAIASSAPKEMFKGSQFPTKEKIASMNAYLGAKPIAEALKAGADIVITGRCADSALTLAACQYEFGWQSDEYDLLAAGSLAGHLLECGPQATGGNFTDWHLTADTLHNIGYPVAKIDNTGAITITKPENTGGLVSVGTVSEQLVYEIEDPQNYLLPDVICDFSGVTIEQIDEDSVRVTGAKGRPPTGLYKVSTTYMDGFKCGTLMTFIGFDAARKARTLGEAILKRANTKLRASNIGDYTETSIELIGDDSQFSQKTSHSKEVTLKIAARHPKAEALGLLLKEIAGIGLATPAGLTAFNAGRPKPMPMVRLFSFLISQDALDVKIQLGDALIKTETSIQNSSPERIIRSQEPENIDLSDTIDIPLIDLAWARSGDKGDRANVGIIARKADYIPYISHALTEKAVQQHFSHFNPSKVDRFFLPGLNAINFVLHDVLGGGGIASLRVDPQGKAYGQILLHHRVKVPKEIARQIEHERQTS
jgi:hypothetical protein